MRPCEGLDLAALPSPCYVVDVACLRRNLEALAAVRERARCEILLALKGFAMFSVFPLCREHLSGSSASSLWEAQLGHDEFGGELHACVPAYRPDELARYLEIVDHLTFNSMSEWCRHRDAVRGAARRIQCAIRVNPACSFVSPPIYDPCGPRSRLGVTVEELRLDELDGISGLHFHALCEQGADVLERVLRVVEERFAGFLERVSWVNFGGGHHITRVGYDVDLLVAEIKRFRERWGVDVYLEPGEAIAINTGVLVATVLDVVQNEMPIAMLDTSASAHMPDVLEMPYRPVVRGAGEPGERAWTCRLGGGTCLAGDVIGDYSFDAPLEPGGRIVLEDMAHYTMVKNTTFNGVRLPSIATFDPDSGRIEVVREFSYEDYRGRLS
jgi:carboxynorspermidine decarboxylase